jgi:hypothetical protein
MTIFGLSQITSRLAILHKLNYSYLRVSNVLLAILLVRRIRLSFILPPAANSFVCFWCVCKFHCLPQSNFLFYAMLSIKGELYRGRALSSVMLGCSPVKLSRRFGRTGHFHLQGRRVSKKQGARRAACLLLVSCFAYTSTLKMEAICSSESSIDSNQTTRCYIPECRNFHSQSCENLKSSNFILYFEISCTICV